jgi:hypothetical protein
VHLLPPDHGSGAVPDYRIYTLDEDGHISSGKDFVFDDDKAAIEHAKQLVDGHDIELWQADRKITTLKSVDKK